MEISSIEKSPTSSGKPPLLAFMAGKPLTRRLAMLAKCCECMNGYIDGKRDCKVSSCPLHPFMPYRE